MDNVLDAFMTAHIHKTHTHIYGIIMKFVIDSLVKINNAQNCIRSNEAHKVLETKFSFKF